MVRMETIVDHRLFVGGPADGHRIAVQGDPSVFYIDEPPKIDYRVPIEDQDVSRMSHRTTHEYIRQRHVRYGIIYVHKDTLDMWEFEREIEESLYMHGNMSRNEFNRLYMCEFRPEEDQ